MRRLHGLLLAAVLAAPTIATAGPDPRPDDSWSDHFEWSMATSRGRLGVLVVGITPELRKHFGAPEDRGVLVGRVLPKSAAAAAGLAVGDILTEVKGTAIDAAPDVFGALATARKNDTISLTVVRDHHPIVLAAKLLDDASPIRRDVKLPSWVKDWFDSVPFEHTPVRPDSSSDA